MKKGGLEVPVQPSRQTGYCWQPIGRLEAEADEGNRQTVMILPPLKSSGSGGLFCDFVWVVFCMVF